MKLGTTILSISMLAAALTLGATHARAEDAPAGGAMDVPALWKKNCASCHGEDGKGQTKAGKTKKVEDLTNPEIRAIRSTVKSCRKRCTRPPSWSTVTSNDGVRTARTSRTSAASCS